MKTSKHRTNKLSFPVFLLTLLTVFLSLNTFAQEKKKKKRGEPFPDFEIINGQNVCVGDTVEFKNNSTGYSVLKWDFGDKTTTTTQKILPTHTYTKPGVYQIELTAISDDGTFRKTTLSILVNVLPTIVLETNPAGTVFHEGEKMTITVVDGFEKYKWTTENDIIGDDRQITIEKAGEYKVEVEDANSCINTQSITITQKDAPAGYDAERIIVENNIITPNGDGYNDFLKIKDLAYYSSACEVKIYNVWGDLVFSESNYQNDWDGSNGKSLDAGTYYYVFTSKGKKSTFGYVDIIR